MSGPLLVSYVVLWFTVLALSVAVVALLRQVGVLHARLAPMGVNPGGEGPRVGDPAPVAGPFGYSEAERWLLAFTSPTCELCARLRPSIDALTRQYGELRHVEIDHGSLNAATFRAFNIWSTPFFVVVDREGIVLGAGVANTMEQVEELIDTATATRRNTGQPSTGIASSWLGEEAGERQT